MKMKRGVGSWFIFSCSDKCQDSTMLEKCVCAITEMEMFLSDNVDEFHRYRGEVAVDIGFKKMGVTTQEKHKLIEEWSNELGRGVSDCLSQDHWFMYIYYRFMAWRILQMKSLKVVLVNEIETNNETRSQPMLTLALKIAKKIPPEAALFSSTPPSTKQKTPVVVLMDETNNTSTSQLMSKIVKKSPTPEAQLGWT